MNKKIFWTLIIFGLLILIIAYCLPGRGKIDQAKFNHIYGLKVASQHTDTLTCPDPTMWTSTYQQNVKDSLEEQFIQEYSKLTDREKRGYESNIKAMKERSERHKELLKEARKELEK